MGNRNYNNHQIQKEKYREIYLKAYNDNLTFIEKGIFTITAGAITFLLQYSANVNEKCFGGYVFCLGAFIITLLLQLCSAYVAKKACDKALAEETEQESIIYFERTNKLNKVFMICFFVSVLATAIVIPINSCKKTETKNHNVETIILIPKYEHSERMGCEMKKDFIAQNGFIPPKQIINEMLNKENTAMAKTKNDLTSIKTTPNKTTNNQK